MESTTVSTVEDESMSMTIVRAVAEEKDTEPIELEINLQDYIDTDGIERLASQTDASWTLSFELPETTVTVTGNGLVHVHGPSNKATS